MSIVCAGSNAAFSRIPLLLSVIEGMLEVGCSLLSELEIKKIQSDLNKESECLEKTQSLIDVILEQQNFVKVVSLDCKEWRKMSPRPQQLRQIEKLEAYLKNMAEVHVKLLENLEPSG